MALIFVDCEAPYNVGSPSVGDMTEFGAVEFKSRQIFHGKDCSKETFNKFWEWLNKVSPNSRPVFVSDNNGWDYQWINFYFWKYFNCDPFGHSSRRISDYFAGLCGNFYKTQNWKKFRVTKHTHSPIDDAMGNVEAFEKLINMNLDELREV